MTEYVVYTGESKKNINYLGTVNASNHNVAENKAEREYARELGAIMITVPKSSAHITVPTV